MILHVGFTNRADVADSLGDDEVGSEPRYRLGIQHVQRIAERVCGAHHSVDLAGRGVRIDDRSRHARDAGMQTLRRIVTVVRDADEHLERAERADDLCGRGKKRDDAH